MLRRPVFSGLESRPVCLRGSHPCLCGIGRADKVETEQYQELSDFQWDVHQIAKNAMAFHEQGSEPWELASRLTEALHNAIVKYKTGRLPGSSSGSDDEGNDELEMAPAEIASEQQHDTGLGEPVEKRARLDNAG